MATSPPLPLLLLVVDDVGDVDIMAGWLDGWFVPVVNRITSQNIIKSTTTYEPFGAKY